MIPPIMMKPFVALLICSSFWLPLALAENWPQMRGPHGTCVADAQDLPTEFGPEKNVVWKVELPGHRAATQIAWGDSIFVMSPVKDDVCLYCFDTSGHERWRKKLGTG